MCALALLGMVGCTTYDNEFRAVREHYVAGNHDAALAITSGKVKQASAGDALVWEVEDAAIRRAAGRFDESEAAFENAYNRYLAALDAAKIRIAQGGAAMLSTPANLPYDGTGYDGIMINTYQVLNALQKNDKPGARVHLTRAYVLQQEIVQENAKRIEQEMEAAGKDANIKKNLDNRESLFEHATAEMAPVQSEVNAYADYVNPFTVYLDGLFHLTQANDNSDIERARKSLERAAAFAPSNAALQHDLKHASEAVGKPHLPPSVYVMFETGMAPSLEQVRIDIPIIITVVSYVGISYPKLRLTPEFIPYLNVAAGTGRGRSELVASMDAIVAREFKNNFPSTLTKAIAAAVTKTVASTAANIAAAKSNNAWVKLGSQISTAVYQAATNVADTRSWQTLPKEFQVCRLDMPASREITLSSPHRHWQQAVQLIPGNTVVVYVKAIQSANTISVNQFTLD